MHRKTVRHVVILSTVVFSMVLAVPMSQARTNLGDPATSRVTLTMKRSKQGCMPTYTATGFAPNTTYPIAGYYGDGALKWMTSDGWGQIETDEAGEASGQFDGDAATNGSLSFQVNIGGIPSAVVSFTC